MHMDTRESIPTEGNPHRISGRLEKNDSDGGVDSSERRSSESKRRAGWTSRQIDAVQVSLRPRACQAYLGYEIVTIL
jgi:hypothetical protein